MKTLSTRRVITILFHYCSAPTSFKCYKLRKQVKKWPIILLPTASFVESPFWQKKTSKWLPALLFVWNCPIRLAGSKGLPGILLLRTTWQQHSLPCLSDSCGSWICDENPNCSWSLRVCLHGLMFTLLLNQRRIQDFHDGGANSQRGCGKLFFPKTAWKWKEFNPRGGGKVSPWHPPWICQC